MKNLRLLPLIFALLFFTGCDLIDKIKGLETFEIAAALNGEYPVHVSETDPLSIDTTFDISSKSHPDIAEYINDVQGYDLITATLMITNWIEGDEDIVFNGSVTLGPVTEIVENLNPYTFYMDGNAYYLSLDSDDLQQINEDFNADDKISVRVNGTVSDKPIHFIIKLTLDLNVEVETDV